MRKYTIPLLPFEPSLDKTLLVDPFRTITFHQLHQSCRRFGGMNADEEMEVVRDTTDCQLLALCGVEDPVNVFVEFIPEVIAKSVLTALWSEDEVEQDVRVGG